MDGTYNNFTFTTNTSSVSPTGSYPPNWMQPQIGVDIPSPKCKCPNTKHTQGCSLPPEDDHCIFCKRGCLKRINVVHLKFDSPKLEELTTKERDGSTS